MAAVVSDTSPIRALAHLGSPAGSRHHRPDCPLWSSRTSTARSSAVASHRSIRRVSLSIGAENEKRQTPVSAPRFERATPTVLAVRKTRDSIVSVKVQKKTSRKETVGTGVIVDERGYVVTNRHVVANAVEVNVVLSDNTSYKGEIDFEDAGQAEVA